MNGTYTLSTSTTIKWGGVNPVDALLVNKHYVGLPMPYIWDALETLAGDVNNDKAINPVDALLINKRYVGLINKFTDKNANVLPDWLFTIPTVTIDNLGITQNIKALCLGDVNASYILPINPYLGPRVTSNELAVMGSTININLNQPFEIPIYLNDNAELGALGIKFINNNSNLKITGISSSLAGLVYNITEDGVNLAWSAEAEGYSVTPGKPIFFINCLLNEDVAGGKSINNSIDITSESVLADIDANLINTDKLFMPEIVVSNNQQSAISFTCYPNPFSNITNMNYIIPENANVEINLYNVLGQKIACLSDAMQQAGNHIFQYDGSNLNPGVYYCRIDVHNGNSTYTKTNILMIAR